MRCPQCYTLMLSSGEFRTAKVTDSRHVEVGNQTRRRRECLSCGHRFTTYEAVSRSRTDEDIDEVDYCHA
jgi:transcriptional repressor NrdR